MSDRDDNNENDLDPMKYLEKAQLKIVNILINKYKLTEDEANELSGKIFEYTFLQIHQKYFQKIPICPDEKNRIQYLKSNIYQEDFVDWHWVAMTIPFYQSLGDTIGYYNGHWEFNYGELNVGPEFANQMIYDFISFGGVNDLSIVNWLASDDTIMYMATLKVLLGKNPTINDYGSNLRLAYIDIFPLIKNRHIGSTTERSLDIQQNIAWDKLPYNSKDIGAGAAMRSGCIGIFFPGSHNRKKLIALSVETSRITHNSATAILGSIVAALFTAYALEKVPINHWPHKLFKLLKSNKIDRYMEKSRPTEYHLYQRDKAIFIGQWEKYIAFRFIGLNPRMDIRIMKNPVKRIEYLANNYSTGHNHYPGSAGDDSVIIAYDSLLESGGVIEKLIVYSILHHGDSDTVGSIALSWFGAYYHSRKYEDLLGNRFEELEFYDKLFDFMKVSIKKIFKIYYYDMYLHFARKYIKKIIRN